jgi:hypothetical protein
VLTLPGPVLVQPWSMSRATELSGAVRFLRVVLWASAGFGLLFLALGVLAIALDASSHDDMWDGLGVFYGKLIAAGGVLWFVPHAGLAMGLAGALRRGRSPKPVGAASAVLGGLLLVFGVYYASAGAARLSTMTPEIAVSFVVLLAGLAVLTDDAIAKPTG